LDPSGVLTAEAKTTITSDALWVVRETTPEVPEAL